MFEKSNKVNCESSVEKLSFAYHNGEDYRTESCRGVAVKQEF